MRLPKRRRCKAGRLQWFRNTPKYRREPTPGVALVDGPQQLEACAGDLPADVAGRLGELKNPFIAQHAANEQESRWPFRHESGRKAIEIDAGTGKNLRSRCADDAPFDEQVSVLAMLEKYLGRPPETPAVQRSHNLLQSSVTDEGRAETAHVGKGRDATGRGGPCPVDVRLDCEAHVCRWSKPPQKPSVVV